MASLRETAIRAALAAGAIQVEHWGGLLNVDEHRRNDIKLEVDRLCEDAIVDIIQSSFPDHSILAEERGLIQEGSDHQWIIDPLDGTVNYFYGLSYFCTSVACCRVQKTASQVPLPRDESSLGDPLVGVVYAPQLDELFVAEKGRGATLNDRPIQASTLSDPAEAMLATGFGSTPQKIDWMHKRSVELVTRVRKMRVLGAAALDICNVACGRLTIFTERGIRSWDIAAGRLIVEEAGGAFSATEYEDHVWDVLASGKGVHQAIKDVVWVD